MKHALFVSVVALTGLVPAAWGTGLPCCNHGVKCKVPPAPPCPDCSDPCANRPHFLFGRNSGHAHKLIAQLGSCDCCERISAARKLGCRLHADCCHDPEVLTALVRALLCDTCWEVRKAAAWGIAMQKARTDPGVLALYLASKLDPHYMVRDAAGDVLDVLIVCRRDCFKHVFERGDALVQQLRGKYKPTSGECIQLLQECCAAVAVPPVAPAARAQ